LPALILRIAAVVATFIVAITFSNIRDNDQSITTTGSATQVIVSDLGILRGTITVQAGSPKEAYQQLQAEKPLVLNYLISKGFSEGAIEFHANYMYNQNGQQIGVSSYTTSQTISVSSTDVNKV